MKPIQLIMLILIAFAAGYFVSNSRPKIIVAPAPVINLNVQLIPNKDSLLQRVSEIFLSVLGKLLLPSAN